METAYDGRVVDNLRYNGASCRTVSGWKHSSTKAILAGVVLLRRRLFFQNQFLYISIGSGTAFIAKKIFTSFFTCMNNISFKANYLFPTNIKKNNTDYQVSFVELNPTSENDMKALSSIALYWDNHTSFAADIFETFKHHYITYNLSPDERYFALTSQKNKFEKLAPSEILGVAQINKSNRLLSLDFLQVDPEYKGIIFDSPYRRIGTALLNSIKKLYPRRDIILKPVESSIEFYKKNGFKTLDRKMIYKA